MKNPRDPRGSQPKNPNEPIDVRHQLGVMRTADYTPQPTQPHLPRVPMPTRMSNLAAAKGTQVEKG